MGRGYCSEPSGLASKRTGVCFFEQMKKHHAEKPIFYVESLGAQFEQAGPRFLLLYSADV